MDKIFEKQKQRIIFQIWNPRPPSPNYRNTSPPAMIPRNTSTDNGVTGLDVLDSIW